MATSTPETSLETRLDGLMLADRRRLGRRLKSAGKLTGARRRDVRRKIDADVAAAERRVALRRDAVPARIAYPEELPITAWRDELLATIAGHQVVIVAGETGSGKSTQLPKLCLELGKGIVGVIGHTQPRRIAARTIAERVAEELATPVGGAVGYSIRFTDEVSDRTLVKVMTDGILLNELHRDPGLWGYDTIIVDEAHERSLNIDFLLGYLKRLLPERPDLTVIITSATIDTARFAAHFDDAPIVEVSGRAYPVEIRYRPLVDEEGGEPREQTDGIEAAVEELSREGRGDILVFCSGEREIRDAVEALHELDLPHTEVLPLFGRLSVAEQHRVFAPHRGRRIVVATNVAETSLTVPGIRYVVDAGTARISRFSRRTKVQRLPIEAISQASADQRAGRCGRLGPGICIRLYSAEDFSRRPEFTDPEILRTNLAAVILQMAAIGLGDIESFPFVDPPDTRTIRDGIALLEELQAVSGDRVGARDWLTDVGRQIARIPLDPRLGRMLLAGADEGCLREVLVIAAALAIIDPRERPAGKEQHADQLHGRFTDRGSDFLTWLNLWRYIRTERRERTSSQFRRMCRAEFLNWNRLREWQDIHAQLRRVAAELGLRRSRSSPDRPDVHRALLTGLLANVGRKDPDGFEYRGTRGVRFAINPGSALFKSAPPWVFAAELVETGRTWARSVAPIEPETIEQIGSHLTRRSLSDPWWDADQGAAVAAETVTMLGLPLITDRRVLASRFNLATARDLFIRHALVFGEWTTHHRFVTHNAAQVEEVLAMEARGRRDLLVDEEARFRFYDRRIPAEVASVHHFDRWWNETRRREPDLLNMTLDDLIAADAADVDDELFPPVWVHGDLRLPLHYEFDPASANDGATVEIPLGVLERIDPAVFEWNVPGFRRDLIAALIKSLPKALRRRFVPVPDTAAAVVAALSPEGNGLIESLRRELTRRGDQVVLPEDFDTTKVPPHLLPAFRIVDDGGNELVSGRDLTELRRTLRAEAREAVAASAHPIERSGITAWDFSDLPRRLTLAGEAHAVIVFPALVDEEASVAIRLFPNPAEQHEAMWSGLRRLLVLQLPNPGKLARQVVGNTGQLILVGGPYANRDEWMADCLRCALDHIMVENGGLVWHREDFLVLLGRVRDQLAAALEDVVAKSAGILARLHDLNQAIAEHAGGPFAAAAEDVVDQVGQFIYPGFLAGVGYGRLDDVVRYLEAAAYRLGKVAENPGRDAELMGRVRVLEDEFDRLADSLPWSQSMVDIAWMLQELRVSYFAQPVGTAGAVSEKRVRRALERLVLPT